ncbi:MAG TPA: FAD-binding protein [Candidatus Saccharimonadales bacterium]|nr:FAD-binding protein [Candidatus Saccharimonadales bacterium]
MEGVAKRTNWAGNVGYRAPKIYFPASVAAARAIVKDVAHITTVGSRHSFNTLADNAKAQICLEKLDGVLGIDADRSTVTIEAGVRYSQLGPYLHANGYALGNLASLPHISVVGACATATHGSGMTNGNLATAVSAIEIIDAAGNLITLTRGDDDFYGAVVGLGLVGIVTKLTLDIEPTYQMSQVVYQGLPMRELHISLQELLASSYSVSLFTDWKSRSINQVWVKSKLLSGETAQIPASLHGARLATEKIHPVPGHSPAPLTEQLGIPGPWHERLPHFKAGFTPSVGNELQSEYFVALDDAYEAIRAVHAIGHVLSPHLFVSEIRTVAADELWMSPSYQQPRVAIHFTWRPDTEVVHKLLPLLEEWLAPFSPVPHWAKLFAMPAPEVRSRYAKLDDFKQLAGRYDPDGKFRNDFLEGLLYAEG